MSDMLALRSFKGGKTPPGMSEAYYKAGVKAIMWRWAQRTQTENYRRLLAGITVSGAPMKPLTNFWKLFKSIKGYNTKIGQKSGQMVKEHGSPRNIKIKFTAASVEARIESAQSPDAIKRIDSMTHAWTQEISSEEMQRKLEIMAEDAGAKNPKIKFPAGAGPFAEGKILKHPDRNWIKRDPEIDKWAKDEIIHLIKTQRRRI